MGRAQRGLFAGYHIQFGNRVSEKGGNTSRRTWKPNVQEKRLFSYILDRQIRVKVTTYALRCIDKAGGIDEYLLKKPYHEMETELGSSGRLRLRSCTRSSGNGAHREARRKMYGWSPKSELKADYEGTDGEGSLPTEFHEGMVANA
uniref:Large ribosomal subunit protein bL28m n=1 Tax=Solanum lycopersicum TaxID=4081 RepID=A0A3Q7IDU8_SOLLC